MIPRSSLQLRGQQTYRGRSSCAQYVSSVEPFALDAAASGMNVVVGSHDIHVGKLLAREDETRAAELRGMSDVIDARQAGER